MLLTQSNIYCTACLFGDVSPSEKCMEKMRLFKRTFNGYFVQRGIKDKKGLASIVRSVTPKMHLHSIFHKVLQQGYFWKFPGKKGVIFLS